MSWGGAGGCAGGWVCFFGGKVMGNAFSTVYQEALSTFDYYFKDSESILLHDTYVEDLLDTVEYFI